MGWQPSLGKGSGLVLRRERPRARGSWGCTTGSAAQREARRAPGGLVTQRVGTLGPETPPTLVWRARGLALGLSGGQSLGDLELSDRSPFTENLYRLPQLLPWLEYKGAHLSQVSYWGTHCLERSHYALLEAFKVDFKIKK